MSSEIAFNIAVLVPHDSLNETTVKYCQIDCSANKEQNGDFVNAFEELPQSYFVSGSDNTAIRKNSSNVSLESCSKAFSLSHAATYDATTFLSDNFPRFQRQKKKKGTTGTSSGFASISTGHAALMLSRDNSADSTFRSPQYHAVTFSLPQSKDSTLAETVDVQMYHQLLMIRQPGLQRSGPMSLSKDLWSFEAFDVVEICTGMCLFSEQDLSSCIQNGKIQPAQLNKLSVSLSEKDIIARLSTTIANTSALYYHGNEIRRKRVLHINIDIPSVQYYKDALASYSDGLCGPADVMEWITAIKSRRGLLFDALAKAIRYGLRERCVSEDSVDITLSSGLKGADEGVFCALKFSPASQDWLRLIMDSVLSDSQELWADFMNIVAEKERQPSSWREFSTLSYMYEVAKPVLRSRSAQHVQQKIDECFVTSELTRDIPTEPTVSAPHSPKLPCTKQTDFFDAGVKLRSNTALRVLLLAIDDVDECRIYTKAYQSLCRLSTASARSPGASPISLLPVTTRILTVCPAPQVIVGTSGFDAKWTRPSLWRSPLRRSQNCGEALRFRTESHLLETEEDVLKQVYPKDLITKVESWVGK